MDLVQLYMPLVFKSEPISPTPTITNTPKPTATEPPPPTATPTPVYVNPSTYTWLWIGRAENIGEQIKVIGIAPGYCYDVLFNNWEDHPKGKLAVLRSAEIQENTWWCTSPPWNPDAVWPPPQYPIPSTLPPEFGYGEIFSKVFNWNAAIVCGNLNCVEAEK